MARIILPICCSSWPFLAHSKFFDYKSKSITVTKDGEPLPLDSTTLAKIDEAFTDFRKYSSLSEKRLNKIKKQFKFYYAKSEDVVPNGSIWFRFCKLGLPYCVKFNQPSEVIDYVEYKGLYYDWESQLASNYVKNHLLSERAKKYIIAKGICRLTDTKILPINLAVNSLLSIIFSFCYNRTEAKPAKVSIIILLIIGVFSLSGLVNRAASQDAAMKAANFSNEYLVGGIEFYQKSLNRNKFLQDLINDKDKGFSLRKIIGQSKNIFSDPHKGILTKLVKKLKQELKSQEKRNNLQE